MTQCRLRGRLWLMCLAVWLLGSCGGSGSQPALQSIEITPSVTSAAAGTTTSVEATGVYADGSHQDITSAVTWSTSNASVATVDSSGTVTGVAPGSANISAALQGLTGSAVYLVTPAVVVSIEVTPAKPSLALGTQLQLVATGVFSDKSTQNLTADVSWSSGTTAVATVSGTGGVPGIVTAASVGATAVTATFNGVSGSTVLTVTPAALTSIEVTPARPGLAKGLTQQLTATGVFSDQTTQNLTGQVTWSSSATGVATVGDAGGSTAPGLAAAVGTGTSVIMASLGGVQGSTTLTVSAATLVSIGITPAAPSVAKGLSQPLTATGTYTDGSTQNVTTGVTWSASTPAVATISNASGSNGVASALAAGSTTVTATLGGVSASTTLTVTSAALVSIQVTPPAPSIASGLTQQLTATGTYSDNSTQDLTATATWSSSDPSIATVSNAAGAAGLASSAGVGSAQITATYNGVSGSVTLTVTQATLVSIGVTPALPSIALGLTQQLTATGVYTDSSKQNLTASVTWSSSSSSVATISNAAGSNGLATSAGVGSTQITATLDGVTGSTTVTVTQATLVSIAITPPLPSVVSGLNQQLTATGTYTDGSAQDLTASATWSSSDSSIATISNAASSNGLATAVGPGSATLTATYEGVTASTTLTVVAATLVSCQITPASPTVPQGLTQPFTATGSYNNNQMQNLTTSATWTSSDTSVATISNAESQQGLATVSGMGQTTISATVDGIACTTAQLTGTNAQLQSITISPSTPSTPTTVPMPFTAMAMYSNSSTPVDLTDTVTWSSSDTSVATISNAAGSNGVATPLAVGSTQITATLAGVSGSATLTVIPVMPVSITVSPASVSIPKGGTQQFTATGTNNDGTTEDMTSSVTWSSSDTTLAAFETAGSPGLATGVGVSPAGSPVTITATAAGANAISGTATLTVTAATVCSIQLYPATATAPTPTCSPTPQAGSSYANGTSVDFKALATFTDLTTSDVTQSASWTSSNTDIVTVTTAAGLAAADFLAAGSDIAADFVSANSNAIATLTASYSGFQAAVSVTLYESFSQGTQSLYSNLGPCSGCHNINSPASGAVGWYDPGPMTTTDPDPVDNTYNRLESAYGLSSVETQACTPGGMMLYLGTSACAFVKAWQDAGYPEN